MEYFFMLSTAADCVSEFSVPPHFDRRAPSSRFALKTFLISFLSNQLEVIRWLRTAGKIQYYSEATETPVVRQLQGGEGAFTANYLKKV